VDARTLRGALVDGVQFAPGEVSNFALRFIFDIDDVVDGRDALTGKPLGDCRLIVSKKLSQAGLSPAFGFCPFLQSHAL
jgi:hypothetical protein